MKKATAGSNNAMAKLNESQVREMRRLHRNKVPYHELAMRYRVNQWTVWQIVTRKAWKHVEDECDVPDGCNCHGCGECAVCKMNREGE